MPPDFLRRGPKPSDPIKRFMAKVSVDSTTGCWIWSGCVQGFGYGCFYLNGKREQAHRASLVLLKGCDVAGKIVMHRCDQPRCVNPDHLTAGSHADNVADRVSKDRSAKGDRHGMRVHPNRRATGERNAMSAFTDKQIAAIQACNLPDRHIAMITGVSPSTIGRIKKKIRKNIDQMETEHVD